MEIVPQQCRLATDYGHVHVHVHVDVHVLVIVDVDGFIS
jgi:hypothetical protein